LNNGAAWVVSANMGLGHQRATYPLRDLAAEKIFLFGDDMVKSPNERRLWNLFRKSYEFISRTRQFPIIGPSLFNLLEKLQNISPYYPFRDQSRPSFQLKSLYSMIRRGLGHDLFEYLASERRPIITSFYAAAIAAEEFTDLPVYCIICDADINRVWVADKPKKSRIVYFAPCGHALRRLKQYGVPDDRIYLTGFPLPQENIGGSSMHILKGDLEKRLLRLDPTHRFRTIHGEEAKYYLGQCVGDSCGDRPLTITYAVGGAGAQAEIAKDVISSLVPLLRTGKMHLNLVAGVRTEVRDYFVNILNQINLYGAKSVDILYQENIFNYFREFNRIMRSTDLLWTKPSELSFYCGLGIPIIIAPSIGPHEVYNLRWIREIGGGLRQEDPRYCREWLMDYLVDGRLAQASWDGFLYARKMGAYKIEEVLSTGRMNREVSPLKR